jgi:RNA polymerase sigma factor (sigma-70 family)
MTKKDFQENVDEKDKPRKKRERRAPSVKSLQEILNSPEERLKELLGITDNQELRNIYTRVVDALMDVKLVVYENNTVDGRGGKEHQLTIKDLSEEKFLELDKLFADLKIYPFPEPNPKTKTVDMVIEHKRELEVLRILGVLGFSKRKIEMDEYVRLEKIKKEALRAELVKAQEEAYRRAREAAALDNRVLSNSEIERISILTEAQFYEKIKKEREGFAEAEKLRRQHLEERVLELLESIEVQKLEVDDLKDFDGLENTPLDDNFGFAKLSKLQRVKPERKISSIPDANLEITDEDEIPLDEELEKIYSEFTYGYSQDRIEREHAHVPIRPYLGMIPNRFKWRTLPNGGKTLTDMAHPGGPKTYKSKAERIVFLNEIFLKAKKFEETEEGREALYELIMAHKNLIAWVIRRLKDKYYQTYGLVDPDDLFQMGIIGLIRAVKNSHGEMDKNKSGTYVEYLVQNMEGVMRNAVETGSIFNAEINHGTKYLRNPNTDARKKYLELQKIRENLKREFPWRQIEDREVAKVASDKNLLAPGLYFSGDNMEEYNNNLKYAEREYKSFLAKHLYLYSEVEAELYFENEALNLSDVDMNGNDVYYPATQFDEVLNKQLRVVIEKVMRKLPPRMERILRLRFGFTPQKEMGENEKGEKMYRLNPEVTFEEIGAAELVSRERIRQLEAKALRMLMHPSRSRNLRSFLPSE